MTRTITSSLWFCLAVLAAPCLVYCIDWLAGYRWTEASVPHDMAVFGWGVWVCAAVSGIRETFEKARGE